MNDLQKLKDHFEGFKNLEFINSKSVQSRVDAFDRFCQKGIPSLKQDQIKREGMALKAIDKRRQTLH